MRARVVPCALTLLTLGACATTRSSELEPTFVAVHNTLAAAGMSQVGPIQRGSLDHGRKAHIRMDLGAHCTTVVAFGGEGVRDLDATLLDPEGSPVAHDVTHDPQASVHACLTSAGTYTLVVTMARGAGDFITAAWTGAQGGAARAARDATAAAAGTCEQPIPLSSRVVTGTTRRGEREHTGSCGSSESRELIYRFDVPRRQRVVLEVDPQFDSVLYVRRGECDSAAAEVACNDDAPTGKSKHGARGSRVDRVLEPGTYFAFVDGYGDEAGSFRLTYQSSDVPTLADACQRARRLSVGKVSGTLASGFDHAQSTCGQGAKGPDVPHRLDLPQRARVRLTASSSDFEPVLHVRRQCVDAHTAEACSDAGATDEDATYVGLLDAGSHTVFVDASQEDAAGAFDLTVESAPLAGSGVVGDACGDALPLSGAHGETSGDTFLARDDVAGKCGGQGAADVVYRLELPRKSHVRASLSRQEGEHVLVLTRSCADRTAEEACGRAIDTVLPAGTHYLAVDGATADALGRYALSYDIRDVAALDAACGAAPTLASGRPVKGTTVGAADKLTTSCAGPEDGQASADKIYKIVVPRPARIRITLETPSWDGVLALRSACAPTPAARTLADVEVACNNDDDDSGHARIERAVAAGTYYVVVDGHAAKNEGAFTLEYRVVK